MKRSINCLLAKKSILLLNCVLKNTTRDILSLSPGVYPYLSYAIISWGSACKTNLRKIITKQNKCVRSIVFAYSREIASPYYNLLGILKFENVYKFKVALFTHKILNDSTNISIEPLLRHLKSIPTIQDLLRI